MSAQLLVVALLMHSRLMKFDNFITANERSCSRMLALLPEVQHQEQVWQ